MANHSFDTDRITMSIPGHPTGEREYKFIVADNGEVLLQSNISTIDGEGLAREFMQTLTIVPRHNSAPPQNQ